MKNTHMTDGSDIPVLLDTLPGCMMPDGGEACDAYRRLVAENERLKGRSQFCKAEHLAGNAVIDDLLAALKMLVAHCEAGLDDESDLEFARAAIAKAEGE